MKSPRYEQLTPEELHRWLEEKKKITLIDTLGRDHFRRIHLPSAVNACVFEVTFLDQVRALVREQEDTLVVYGSSARSMDGPHAAEKLLAAGYEKVGVLGGGLEGWRGLGFPVEGDAVAEPDDPQTFLNLEDGTYPVDTEKSIVEWRGRNPNNTHYGSLKIIRGELVVKQAVLTGSFEMDMESITNKNLEGDALQPVLIAHLKSEDFFLTRLFPHSRFTIIRGEPVKEPFLSVQNYRINGLLELRGVKAEQEFMATLTRTPENGLAAEAHFDLDRTRWKIIYGSARFFEHLGMHLVFDLITIQLRIVTTPS